VSELQGMPERARRAKLAIVKFGRGCIYKKTGGRKKANMEVPDKSEGRIVPSGSETID